jgi:hypothetical protein
LHACDLDSQALGCTYGDKTRWVLEQTRLWNGQHWHNNKEIPGELGTIKKKKRMPAHQTFLLRPYPLMLLHKNNRQILVHRIWYFVKTLQVSTVLAFMATLSGKALQHPCL